jgi:tail assembly chaperone E/41/14-like protein
MEAKLNHPIEVNGELTKVITLNRPVVRDMLAMDNEVGEMAKIVALISSCSGLTPREVGSVGAEDFIAVSETVGEF